MIEEKGVKVRETAIRCVLRIEESKSYANIVVPKIIQEASLDSRDRNLVTEIAYGSTRMKRSLDWAIDRFLPQSPPPPLRAELRVGAYQILFMRVPAHAAVSATVSASSKRNKGVVNAVLRKISNEEHIDWPSDSIRLSYPEWILNRLSNDLGAEESIRMMEMMNRSPNVTKRSDGYIQDQASQWIANLIHPEKEDLILDLCAAPGGKATALANKAFLVVASDISASRQRLVTRNIGTLRLNNVLQVIGNGETPPYRTETFDKVLVDAPCSGLGVLHRRADARWRIKEADVKDLAELQLKLLSSAAELVKPGGELIYSVCTVTRAETINIATELERLHPGLNPVQLQDTRWRQVKGGLQILPQDHGTDGMTIFKWVV